MAVLVYKILAQKFVEVTEIMTEQCRGPFLLGHPVVLFGASVSPLDSQSTMTNDLVSAGAWIA